MTNDKADDLFKAMAKEAGFTDEQVVKAMAAPQWKEIQNRDNRHSEYASALDKAKNLEPLANKAKEWDKWWTEKGGSKLYETQQNQATVLARYQERFGELDPNNAADVNRAANVAGLTLAQAQAMLAEREASLGQRFSSMQSDILLTNAELQSRGINPSPSDIVAMNKLMSEKGVTYGAAAAELLGPKVRELEQQKLTKEKEDYAAEKVRDALSRVGHTGIPTEPSVPGGFFDRPANGIAEKSMSDQELLSMWNDSAPGAKSRAA